MDKVVHFDVPVDNVERAKKFYQQAFGWKIQEVPGMPYWTIHTVDVDQNQMPKEPGAINGGMYKRDQKGDVPVIVVNVHSLDDHLKKVQKAGGRVVMPKRAVGEMGWYARIQDTEGNQIGLWQNSR